MGDIFVTYAQSARKYITYIRNLTVCYFQIGLRYARRQKTICSGENSTDKNTQIDK